MSILSALILSFVFVLVVARPSQRLTRRQILKLLILTLFTLPLHLIWPALYSFHRNTQWNDSLSTAWALPIVLFATVGLLALAEAIRIYFSSELNLDQSLRSAWMDLLSQPQKNLGRSLLITLALESILIVSTI